MNQDERDAMEREIKSAGMVLSHHLWSSKLAGVGVSSDAVAAIMKRCLKVEGVLPNNFMRFSIASPFGGNVRVEATTPFSCDIALKPGEYISTCNDVQSADPMLPVTTVFNGLILVSDRRSVIHDGLCTFTPYDADGCEGLEAVSYIGTDASSDETKYMTFMDVWVGLEQTAIVWTALHGDDQAETNDAILSISTNAIKEIDFATDKLNQNAWKQWEGLQPGQLAMGFSDDGSGEIGIDLASAADRKRGIQRIMTYMIDFDGLESTGIAPRLQPFDRRVYEALSSLWNRVTAIKGQDTFSLKDICYAMGYKGNPNAATKKKVNDSITKMSAAHISVDNATEARVYGYPVFRYDASLLPMERVTGYVDGQITDGLIHLFREPPLLTFARERKQVTTGSVRLLQTPLSKTNKNIMLEDYIRDQIAWMKNKNGGRSRKILYSSLFEATKATRRDDRLRQKEDAIKLLNHYVKCGWFYGFKQEQDGVVILLEKPKEKPKGDTEPSHNQKS